MHIAFGIILWIIDFIIFALLIIDFFKLLPDAVNIKDLFLIFIWGLVLAVQSCNVQNGYIKDHHNYTIQTDKVYITDEITVSGNALVFEDINGEGHEIDITKENIKIINNKGGQ